MGSNGPVNIIYYINQEEKLPPFLSKLQQLLCDNICFQALQLIYKYQGSLIGLLNRRRISQFERNYISQLKDEFDVSNPQESQPPYQRQQPPKSAWAPLPSPLINNDSTVTQLSDRLQSLESFIDEFKKSNYEPSGSTVSTSPPESSQEDISTLISTQVNSATASLRTEFEDKFKSIDTRCGNIENSISDIDATTKRLDASITKFENTNSQLLQFLKQHHSFPASGPNTEPRANT